MMRQKDFHELVLNFISNDFKAPSTITTDIVRELAREVTEAEVLEALLALARDGQAQAYVYNASSHEYVQVNVDSSPRESLWFMARPTR